MENRMTAGKERFPALRIDLSALQANATYVVDRCREQGIAVAGVVKGTNALLPCVRRFEAGGVAQIASSRLEQLAAVRTAGTRLPLMLIRVPMLSEVEDVVRIADISLVSEVQTLRALDKAAGEAGRRHGIILMADLGDLREGFWSREEIVETALLVEKDLKNLDLLGIGTNLGCYGSILPTCGKMDQLGSIAYLIENKIGRQLQTVSGGATSSLMRVFDHNMPDKVNHLRIGEGILNARDLAVYYGYDMREMRQDVYTLRAEVIEVREKPTKPVGETGVDAFGHKQRYEDHGIRRRALIAVGKADIGSPFDIFPRMKGIQVLGGSSDHTILDIEDAEEPIRLGDVLSFDVNYGAMLYLTASANVHLQYIE